MPTPNPKLLKVGLWPRSETPTQPLYRVLVHLAGPGEPRLYVQRNKNGGIVQVSVSNTSHKPGFSANKIWLDSALWGGGDPTKPWLSLDEETTKKCAQSISAYKINEKGLEAIAQYEANRRYHDEAPDLARQILRECRRAVSARDDN